jgi:anti-sigma B factor antagonist
MQITEIIQNKTSIVAISGSVDALTADEVTQYLTNGISAGKEQIVLDLSQVDFMSSAGLRAILATLKESRKQGGNLHLANAQPGVEKILKMSGITSIVKTFSSIDAAVAEFSG